MNASNHKNYQDYYDLETQTLVEKRFKMGDWILV